MSRTVADTLPTPRWPLLSALLAIIATVVAEPADLRIPVAPRWRRNLR